KTNPQSQNLYGLAIASTGRGVSRIENGKIGKLEVSSAPADAIDGAAAILRPAGAYADAARTDADACDGPRTQRHAGPCDAAGRITDIRAINDGARLLRACADKAGGQQGAGENE